MKKVLLLLPCIFMITSCSTWEHREGLGQDQFAVDKKECIQRANTFLIHKYGSSNCKEYKVNFEQNEYSRIDLRKYPRYMRGRLIKQIMRNSKLAYKECKQEYRRTFESCMSEKGWQKQ